MRIRSCLPFALVTLALGGFAACSSKPPPPPVTPSLPDAAAEAGDAEAGAVEGGMGAVTADASTEAGPINPAMGGEMMDGTIDLAVKAAAVKDAPNMQAEGQPSRVTLAEGEHFNMLVTLQPNRCYTFVAFSPPGQVATIEAKLLAPPLFNVEAGKSAATDKNLAEIGKAKGALCPVLPIAVPYKLDVAAKKGAGRVGVYVYARNK